MRVTASTRLAGGTSGPEHLRPLLGDGRAVIGRTELDGAVQLKLTVLNPHTTQSDLDALIDDIVAAGEKETPTA